MTALPIEDISSPSFIKGEVTPGWISRKRTKVGVNNKRPPAAGSFVPNRSVSAPEMGDSSAGSARIRNKQADFVALKPKISWT